MGADDLHAWTPNLQKPRDCGQTARWASKYLWGGVGCTAPHNIDVHVVPDGGVVLDVHWLDNGHLGVQVQPLAQIRPTLQVSPSLLCIARHVFLPTSKGQ